MYSEAQLAQRLIPAKIYNGWGSKCSYRAGPNWQSMKRKQLVGGDALAVLVCEIPIHVSQTASHKKKWKPAFFEYIFHNILYLQRAAKQKGQGILVFSSYFQTENWSCCCDCRACQVGFPWLAQTATAVQPRWYGTRAAVEAYAKLDVALLMNARFWSPTRVTSSRSWGYQSHLQ